MDEREPLHKRGTPGYREMQCVVCGQEWPCTEGFVRISREMHQQLAASEAARAALVEENRLLREFAENMRDNWGVLSGGEVWAEARALLARADGGGEG